MDLKEYGKRAISTLTSDHGYGDINAELMGQILGLVGETGEIAEKFKKIIRDKAGKLSDVDRAELAKELGDVLWYVNAVVMLLGSDIETVAKQNLEKLQSRKARGALHGSGDNR
jgi:NTP pyrophosphatase (non-canonical NTP hydrolase)